MAKSLSAATEAVRLSTSARFGALDRVALMPTRAQNARSRPACDLVDVFAENVRRRGHWTAVEAGADALSYAQLDRLANQLAHRLLSLGVGRESRVGVSLPRGLTELVALLATLKAGAAYVPLDPSNPLARLSAIVEDAAPQALIVHSTSPLVSTATNVEGVIVLDDLVEATLGYRTTPPQLVYDPAQLAYVLFTSGSTGRPKGVEVTRGAFGNFLQSMAHTPGLAEHERLLAVTTTSFDIAGLELFLPLWVGATVVVADRETARDPRLIRKLLETADVSVMQATPATWRLLLEAGFRGDGKLRMLCGGEALSPELARRLLQVGGELWNMYGPTETTVWSTLARITPDQERINIGRPIDHTKVYVLDEAMRPVEIGHEGELWIGGRGVARGYCGRPDLTAERFVQDPFGAPGERLYRTGDLGRALPDGSFECLGRLDHQVKIRGFRIETGEVESALRSVPGVDEALVIAEQCEGAEPRLLAYWVGTAERDALVEAARRLLPVYMMPAAYAHLSVFPLNSSGKIDRKQLPAPEPLELTAGATEHPRTDSESRIAAIWRDVLGLTAVSVEQDFFALGGNSELALRVVARLSEEIGVELSLASFFQQPTVRGIAERLDRIYAPDEPVVVFLHRGASERPPLWCLFGIAVYQELAHTLPNDRSVIGVHVPFRYLTQEGRQPTIEELAQRYVSVLQREQPHGPYYLLGLCFGGIVAYEAARLLEAAGEVVGFVTVLDAVLPSAVKVDQFARLRSHLQRLRSAPLELGRLLQRGGKKLASRVGFHFRAVAPDVPLPHQGEGELPVDGPAIDAAVERFAARATRLGSPLLIVRATREPSPDWVTLEPDLGWSRLAEQVTVLDVPAEHLGILRAPHVQLLADAIEFGLERSLTQPTHQRSA